MSAKIKPCPFCGLFSGRMDAMNVFEDHMKKTMTEKIAAIIEDLRDDLNDLEQTVGDVEEAPEEGGKYPYVGIANRGTVVLFINKNEGTVINRGCLPFGGYSDSWVEENYHLFTGTIRYKNGQPVETEVSK